jgi:DNA-binding LacI/PurR family transcriptional regulator
MSSRDKTPTIIDVAEAAGVSKSLVSLALGDKPGVKAETRQHIIDVAQRLGYRRNQWASALVGAPTQTIGVALTDLSNAYYTDVAVAVEERAEQANHGVVLVHGRRDADRLATQLERLVALRVDGIVLVGSWVSSQHLARLAQRLPIVVVGRLAEEVPGVDTVRNDDELGARLAVDHLVQRGHRRILHLTRSDRPSSLGRRAGYVTAMQDAGLASQIRIVGAQCWAEQWDSILETIAANDPSAPTAVFASNDQAAHRALVSALDAGVRVPEKLAVVGYDNSTLAAATRPGLTSVDQPRAAMGEQAVQLLFSRMSGEVDSQQQIVAKPTLLPRGSTVSSTV